jgi:hypothetical protein
MEHLWHIANPAIMAGEGPTTHLVLTLTTAVTVGLVIFVTAFLAGLWCGGIGDHWPHRRGLTK